MTYSVSVTCDACGAMAPSAVTTRDAAALAKKGGWLHVRHLGQHFCPKCQPNYLASLKPPKPKRTMEQRRLEQWAATKERLKVTLALRRGGKTWNECGSALGVSGSRAQQLFLQAEHAEARGWKHPYQEEFNMTSEERRAIRKRERAEFHQAKMHNK